MQLDDLKKSAKEMTDEEILDNILKVRAARRNYSRVDKKRSVTKKKEENVDWDEISAMLDGIE